MQPLLRNRIPNLILEKERVTGKACLATSKKNPRTKKVSFLSLTKGTAGRSRTRNSGKSIFEKWFVYLSVVLSQAWQCFEWVREQKIKK